MEKIHRYTAVVTWQGNLGTGTSAYNAYSRNHLITVSDKPPIAASSDAAFRGDPARWTPEDTFVSSLSSCHMLWYLHLCAVNHVIVLDYTDEASGEMRENSDGSGQFERVILRPRVTIAAEHMRSKAETLHSRAHEMCFIARSVNFPVLHEPEIIVQP
jgi:organic hydroperoxide reductase OsmC/OhrA